MTYKELFGDNKPVVAMIHLKGRDLNETLQRAKTEAEIYFSHGINAVMVEDYFGTLKEVEAILAWLQAEHPEKIYGVNIIDDHRRSFELAERYGARFVRINSVSGNLPPKKDAALAKEIEELRQRHNVMVLGGVRIQSKPLFTGRTLKEDLRVAKDRCDAIVVTGDGTGRQTPEAKIQDYRCNLNGFPLMVGGGVDTENITETFSLADGAIVGSYFKTDHKVGGDVEAPYVKTFMEML